ncbi:hypothetical protein WJX72_005971 [[Myrmecia] bisecta]|uniref:Uncharacterized protein n=1 Tax=[Myrmecia] bisecta TaxID=41462 RepID=A0AAW1R6P2_9CHLO
MGGRNFTGKGVGFGLGVGCGFGVGWGFGGAPIGIAGMGAGGGCGVGVGLGWGFGTGFGAEYLNEKPDFEVSKTKQPNLLKRLQYELYKLTPHKPDKAAKQ